jgi:hypothetical protein
VVAHKALNFLATRLSRPKTELAREYSSPVALKALTVEMAATARYRRCSTGLITFVGKEWIREALRKTLDDHEKGNGGKNDEGESPRTEEGEDKASNTGGKVLNDHFRSQR